VLLRPERLDPTERQLVVECHRCGAVNAPSASQCTCRRAQAPFVPLVPRSPDLPPPGEVGLAWPMPMPGMTFTS
jgi:hypothetical protein